MSIKRSHAPTRSAAGGSEGGKVDRQAIFDELKKHAASGQTFTPVDVALAIGAAEPQVAKLLLGLAIERNLEKVEAGRYKATPMAEMSQVEFLKAFSRAGKVDTTRMGDLKEIERLKQNNDVMRQRLLTAQAERDHYLAALKKHGIDPGPVPQVVAPVSTPSPAMSDFAPPAAAAPAPAPAAAPAPVPAAAPAPAPAAAPAAAPASSSAPAEPAGAAEEAAAGEPHAN